MVYVLYLDFETAEYINNVTNISGYIIDRFHSNSIWVNVEKGGQCYVMRLQNQKVVWFTNSETIFDSHELTYEYGEFDDYDFVNFTNSRPTKCEYGIQERFCSLMHIDTKPQRPMEGCLRVLLLILRVTQSKQKNCTIGIILARIAQNS